MKNKTSKNILKIVPILLFAISCKAQLPIINIKNRPAEDIVGAYYKDVDYIYNQFEGTYRSFIRGNELIITLQKKEMNFNNVIYEDMLIGEYKYTKNGVVIIDRLNELNISYLDQRNHSIDGSEILQYGDYLCDECTQNEIKLYGGLVDNITDNLASLMISKTILNGQPYLKVWIGWQMKGIRENEAPSPPLLPGGIYYLTKQ